MTPSAVELDEVGTTLLWNLHQRAAEAARPDAVLRDPWAVELYGRIDFPFVETFGAAHPLQAQGQALRCMCFDLAVEAFAREHPEGTVVALGEGLETQFWRVDNGRLRWISVDLEEPIAARRRLLPANDRLLDVVASAAAETWMAEVDPRHEVLITAQGLLMYMDRAEAHAVLRRAGRHFPQATFVFDVIPTWFSTRTMKGMRSASGYEPPAMPWGVDSTDLRLLAGLPEIADLRTLRLPRGRGPLFGALLPLLSGHLPRPLAYLAPWTVLRAEFADATANSSSSRTAGG